jgi:type IV fimbrial biogenesis protein FimT
MRNLHVPPLGTQQYGLTLVELMVTLGVASILFTLAVPSLTQLYRSHELTSQANEMLVTINFARSVSITRNMSVRLCRTYSETNTSCVTSSGAWQHWLVLASNGEVLQRSVLPDSMGLTQTLDLSDDTITFGADGLARTNGALISGKRFQIQVNADTAGESRCLEFGAGSRSRIIKTTGDCP